MQPDDMSQIWSTALSEAIKKMLTEQITGATSNTTNVKTTIEVHNALFEAIHTVCSKLGISSEDIFSTMATDGFNQILKEKMTFTSQVVPDSQSSMNKLEEFGLNMDNMKNGITKLEDIIGKLKEIEHATQSKTIYANKVNKNSK